MLNALRTFLAALVVTGLLVFLMLIVAGVAAWQLGSTVNIPGVARMLASEENGMPAFYVTPQWTGIAVWVLSVSIVVTILQVSVRRKRTSAKSDPTGTEPT